MFSYTAFIPRVFSNIKESRISDVFDTLNIGSVERVDLVPKTGKNGDTYNMAFVHFAMVYNTDAGNKFRNDIEGPDKKAKIAYDGQWFWHVLPFEQKQPPTQNPEYEFNEQQQQEQQPPQQQQQEQQQQPPQLTSHQMDFVMSHMMPVWVMTPYGPTLQLGCPHFMLEQPYQQHQHQQQYQQETKPKTKRMVPRQVAYGAIYNGQRNQPRKRLNAPRPERREETYARENVSIDDIIDYEKEDGEC
jgi:hypothetical protein